MLLLTFLPCIHQGHCSLSSTSLVVSFTSSDLQSNVLSSQVFLPGVTPGPVHSLLTLLCLLSAFTIFIILCTLIYFLKSSETLGYQKRCNPPTSKWKSEMTYVQIIRPVAFNWALTKFQVSEKVSYIQAPISHLRLDILLQRFTVTVKELRVKGGNWPSLSGKGGTWTRALSPKCFSISPC